MGTLSEDVEEETVAVGGLEKVDLVAVLKRVSNCVTREGPCYSRVCFADDGGLGLLLVVSAQALPNPYELGFDLKHVKIPHMGPDSRVEEDGGLVPGPESRRDRGVGCERIHCIIAFQQVGLDRQIRREYGAVVCLQCLSPSLIIVGGHDGRGLVNVRRKLFLVFVQGQGLVLSQLRLDGFFPSSLAISLRPGELRAPILQSVVATGGEDMAIESLIVRSGEVDVGRGVRVVVRH